MKKQQRISVRYKSFDALKCMCASCIAGRPGRAKDAERMKAHMRKVLETNVMGDK